MNDVQEQAFLEQLNQVNMMVKVLCVIVMEKQRTGHRVEVVEVEKMEGGAFEDSGRHVMCSAPGEMSGVHAWLLPDAN